MPRIEGTTSTYVVALEMLPYTGAFATELSKVKMTDGMRRDWREICVAVTNEGDSTKLSSLIQELIVALNEGERSWRQPIRQPEALNHEVA